MGKKPMPEPGEIFELSVDFDQMTWFEVVRRFGHTCYSTNQHMDHLGPLGRRLKKKGALRRDYLDIEHVIDRDELRNPENWLKEGGPSPTGLVTRKCVLIPHGASAPSYYPEDLQYVRDWSESLGKISLEGQFMLAFHNKFHVNNFCGVPDDSWVDWNGCRHLILGNCVDKVYFSPNMIMTGDWLWWLVGVSD